MTTTSTEITPVVQLRERLQPDIDPALAAELGVIELKVETGYTLADAIREGSTVTGQATGTFIQNGESCALGAGWIAAKARGYVK